MTVMANGKGVRLRVLHLSDLHVGKETTSSWRSRRVLGDSWKDGLLRIAEDANGKPDLVCFTGDLAQSAQAEQYEQVAAFLEGVLHALGVDKSRLFCVPGNHDIDRSKSAGEWAALRAWCKGGSQERAEVLSRWLAGGRTPEGAVAAWLDALALRREAWHAFLKNFGLAHQLPSAHTHGRLGFCLPVAVSAGAAAPVFVAGFDSAWLAGDDQDRGQLRITDEQVGRLLELPKGIEERWVLGLMHHSFADLADAARVQKLMCERGVGVLLHGHEHHAELTGQFAATQEAQIASVGCLYETDQYPNAIQLLDLVGEPGQPLRIENIWTRAWSERGHWHDDDSRHKDSRNGRWVLRKPLKHDDPLLVRDMVFVGRETELQQMRQALLPKNDAACKPVVLEGMPGVGKTHLAEKFIATHWPAGSEQNPSWLRITLDPQQPRSAEDMAAELQSRLQLQGSSAEVFQRVREALLYGPGGHPRLLFIENSDDETLARTVGQLVLALRGCPVLITARYTQQGNASWKKVAVEVLSPETATAQLHAELVEPGTLSESDASALVTALACLPLALHLAAGYLNTGHSTQSFLAELRCNGLDLPSAETADWRSIQDQQRALLKASFAISWQVWQRAAQARNSAWSAALLALAQAPNVELGASLAAAVMALDEADADACLRSAAQHSLLSRRLADRRVRFHPLIAEFLRAEAIEQVSEATLSVQVQERMTEWFLERMRETGDAEQGERWRAVGLEEQTLREWLERMPTAECERVAALAGIYAQQCGPFSAWYNFTKKNLGSPTNSIALLWLHARIALSIGDWEASANAAWDLIGHDGCQGGKTKALAYSTIGDIHRLRGEFDKAMPMYQDYALPIFVAKNDEKSSATTFGKISEIYVARESWDDVIRICESELLPRYTAARDEHGCAVSYARLAVALQENGQFDAAADLLERRVIPTYERCNSPRNCAVAYGQLADILQERGLWGEALSLRREKQIPEFERLGDLRELVVARTNLAACLRERGLSENVVEIARLLSMAHADAARLQLPEAVRISEIYQQIFGRQVT